MSVLTLVYGVFQELKKKSKDEFKNAVYLKAKINYEKLISELKSGTDCAEYVARCTGLSNLVGENKGELWPEDVFNLLDKENDF